jgi:hypothetical protein
MISTPTVAHVVAAVMRELSGNEDCLIMSFASCRHAESARAQYTTAHFFTPFWPSSSGWHQWVAKGKAEGEGGKGNLKGRPPIHRSLGRFQLYMGVKYRGFPV